MVMPIFFPLRSAIVSTPDPSRAASTYGVRSLRGKATTPSTPRPRRRITCSGAQMQKWIAPPSSAWIAGAPPLKLTTSASIPASS